MFRLVTVSYFFTQVGISSYISPKNSSMTYYQLSVWNVSKALDIIGFGSLGPQFEARDDDLDLGIWDHNLRQVMMIWKSLFQQQTSINWIFSKFKAIRTMYLYKCFDVLELLLVIGHMQTTWDQSKGNSSRPLTMFMFVLEQPTKQELWYSWFNSMCRWRQDLETAKKYLRNKVRNNQSMICWESKSTRST